jgi:predicted nicotinamide N-methyase
MLSILCANHLGISGVVATDGDEAVVDAIKTNAFLNEQDGAAPSQGLIRTAALKWGRYIQASTFTEDYGLGAPDVVLGADVVSQPRNHSQLAPAYFNIPSDLRPNWHSIPGVNVGRLP